MVYLRCGEKMCDVYYAEVLAGQLYVGHLYTLNEAEEVSDFCPIKINSCLQTSCIFFTSRCTESSTVKIFFFFFNYKKTELTELQTLPQEILTSTDLELLTYSNTENNGMITEFVLLYSLG